MCLFLFSGAYLGIFKRLFRVRFMHLYPRGPPGTVRETLRSIVNYRCHGSP